MKTFWYFPFKTQTNKYSEGFGLIQWKVTTWASGFRTPSANCFLLFRKLKRTLQICVYRLNFLRRIKLRLCWCTQHSKREEQKKRSWGSVGCPASRWVGGSKERMQEKTQDKERVNMRWGEPSTEKTHVIKLEPVQTDQTPGGGVSAAHLQEFAAWGRP